MAASTSATTVVRRTLRLSARPQASQHMIAPNKSYNPAAAVARAYNKPCFGPAGGSGRAFLSSTTAARAAHQQPAGASAGGAGGAEIPAFSLKQLGLNPRMRYAMAALLLAAGFVEGASWVYFWPRVFGEKSGGEEQEGK